jgi:hypothetical protein
MHARPGAMPTQQSDDHGALTTAVIFDDVVYCLEALNLPASQTEDDYDAELALLARESGIQDPYQFLCSPPDLSRALATMTPDSDHRSSISVHSQETQSTSITSAPSRTSRDRTPPKLARVAPVVETHDHSIDQSPLGVKQRLSSSAWSVSHSVLSDSSASSTPARRRKRGSGLFGIFRKDSRYVCVETV